MKHSLAIAYHMKRREKEHGAGEGPCAAHGTEMCGMCHGGEMMARGGMASHPQHEGVHEDLAYTGREGQSRAGVDAREAKRQKSYGDPDSDARSERAMRRSLQGHRENQAALHAVGKKYDRKNLAEGGYVEEEEESGYEPMPHEHASKHYEHPVENQSSHARMLQRIHEKLSKSYSKGGMVANKDHDIADFEDNEFDDLAKDDHLEEHYTGANSGDEIGDEREDDDRHDIVKRIMKSLGKKDRMPRPA